MGHSGLDSKVLKVHHVAYWLSLRAFCAVITVRSLSHLYRCTMYIAEHLDM